MADTVSQTVLFPDLFDKPLVATVDQQHASSDGGAVLLKAAERQYGLIDGFAECLVDDRQPGKVRHTLADLLGQRIFGIACGHPDGNDGDRLADDPIHKLLLGRDPITGDALASQPTISRFENDVGSQELYAMGQELALSVIERFATLTWVDWFNTRRLLGPLGDIPPAEFEAQYYEQAAVA